MTWIKITPVPASQTQERRLWFLGPGALLFLAYMKISVSFKWFY